MAKTWTPPSTEPSTDPADPADPSDPTDPTSGGPADDPHVLDDPYGAALDRAHAHARLWLGSLRDRPIPPTASADDVLRALGEDLPEDGGPPEAVIDDLVGATEPGLMAMPSGRFYGWVIGGTLPAALAADWLVGAWDQPTGMRHATPGTAAIEECAARWLLDLLGLPAGADVGFTTGATMASFTGLAAARHAVLGRVGVDVTRDGLAGAPPVRVLVGAERHDTIDVALRYLGLGAPTVVPADAQGRIVPEALEAALDHVPDGAPTIVCLQAGNVHSGAFDPFVPTIGAAHRHGAWVHVDGAFGLWASMVPRLAHLTAGAEAADSWTTDAHKTLNVPYDCGVAVVRDPVAMRSAFGVEASYLTSADGPGNPYDRVPELSRRARGVPVWAALRSLGRAGVRDLVDGLAARAAELADGVRLLPGARVLNDVVYTQVIVAFEDDVRTREVAARLIAGGEVYLSSSRWHGRDVLRISVSNWSTDDDAVRRTLAALRRAAASGDPGPTASGSDGAAGAAASALAEAGGAASRGTGSAGGAGSGGAGPDAGEVG